MVWKMTHDPKQKDGEKSYPQNRAEFRRAGRRKSRKHGTAKRLRHTNVGIPREQQPWAIAAAERAANQEVTTHE